MPWHWQLSAAKERRFDPSDKKKLPLPYRWEVFEQYDQRPDTNYLPLLNPGDDPYALHPSTRATQHIFEVRADGADTLLVGTFVLRSWGRWLCESRQVCIAPGDTSSASAWEHIPCAVTLPK